MATVLEECSTEEQRSVVRFLWAKGLSAKDIQKEMVSCSSRKAVDNWVEKFSGTFESRRRCPTRGGSGGDNSQNTFMVRVSTHW
jgi:hypothetical protein